MAAAEDVDLRQPRLPRPAQPATQLVATACRRPAGSAPRRARRSTGRSPGPSGTSSVAVVRSPGRQHLPGLVDRHEFELAAADRAERRRRRDQHLGAGLARRRAPARARPRPARPRRPASRKLQRRKLRHRRADYTTQRSALRRPCPQPLDRHQHALGRRRRVEARADPVVGDARHRHRQRLQHRDRRA